MQVISIDLRQIEFLLFIISLVANIALGITVWRYSPHNAIKIIFELFILAQILWISFNYSLFGFLITNERIVLGIARLTMFFATLHAFTFLLFISSLWTTKYIYQRWWFIPLSGFASFVALLTLTDFVFRNVFYSPTGDVITQTGIGIVVFGVFVILCIGGSFYSLFYKYRNSQHLEQKQWKIIIAGLALSFFLILIFNFFNPVLFNNTNTVRFGHLYTLPFIISASYAILKHHFLNIRIFATELFAFLVIGVSIVQLTLAQNFTELFIGTLLLILVISFSLLLIRSITREIQYRVQEVAYAELQKLDATKSEFITIASHQLRTPLSGLKGYISMAQEGSYGKLPKDMFHVLENMAKSTERLISLADSFLNVSQMRTAKIEINREQTDLKTFIETIVREIKPKVEEKGLVLLWKPPAKAIPQTSLDREKIHTVLINILDNAIRYTKKGSVTIRIERKNAGYEEKGVIISVADTGKGLTAQEVKDIFVSFKRGKTAQALWPEGVGLNLYIAKQFIDAHGGKIWVESAGIGKGSTFFMQLPHR
jgi:signal transduction histidine kinase